jgi:hypothetical protein
VVDERSLTLTGLTPCLKSLLSLCVPNNPSSPARERTIRLPAAATTTVPKCPLPNPSCPSHAREPCKDFACTSRSHSFDFGGLECIFVCVPEATNRSRVTFQICAFGMSSVTTGEIGGLANLTPSRHDPGAHGQRCIDNLQSIVPENASSTLSGHDHNNKRREGGRQRGRRMKYDVDGLGYAGMACAALSRTESAERKRRAAVISTSTKTGEIGTRTGGQTCQGGTLSIRHAAFRSRSTCLSRSKC